MLFMMERDLTCFFAESLEVCACLCILFYFIPFFFWGGGLHLFGHDQYQICRYELDLFAHTKTHTHRGGNLTSLSSFLSLTSETQEHCANRTGPFAPQGRLGRGVSFSCLWIASCIGSCDQIGSSPGPERAKFLGVGFKKTLRFCKDPNVGGGFSSTLSLDERFGKVGKNKRNQRALFL